MTTTKKEEKKTTTTTTKKSNGFSFSGFMNILAFIAVCVGGIGMFLAMILKLFGLSAGWINSLQAVANAIGWIALCLLSIRYIKNRRKIWIWVVWTIAVVMIFTGIIVPLF